MQRKYLRSTIIVLIQTILPALLILIIAPQLINLSASLNQTNNFFQSHQLWFLAGHTLFYLLLYLLWPWFTQLLLYRRKNEILPIQLSIAINARWYLLASLISIELLMQWR